MSRKNRNRGCVTGTQMQQLNAQTGQLPLATERGSGAGPQPQLPGPQPDQEQQEDADPALGGADPSGDGGADDPDPELGGPPPPENAGAEESEEEDAYPLADYQPQRTRCPACGCMFFQDRYTPCTAVTKTMPEAQDGGIRYVDRYMICKRCDCGAKFKARQVIR